MLALKMGIHKVLRSLTLAKLHLDLKPNPKASLSQSENCTNIPHSAFFNEVHLPYPRKRNCWLFGVFLQGPIGPTGSSGVQVGYKFSL